MSRIRGARLAASWAVAVAVVGGCSLLPTAGDPSFPVGVAVVTPRAQMSLDVANQTSVAIRIMVDGSQVAIVQPGDDLGLAADRLPSLPWVVQALTRSGRLLVQLTVHEGDVWQRRNADGSFEQKGDGARVDLSCGRIDVSSGPPLLGPAPGPGVPGDCDP